MRSFLRLFSFYGRSKRSAYWIYILVSVVGFFGLSVIFDLLLFRFDWGHVLEKMKAQQPAAQPVFDKLAQVPAAFFIVLGVIGALFLVALFVAGLAITVRRLHDMGASGWFSLIFVVLNVIGLVTMIGLPIALILTLVLGIWPPSRGNRYGARDGGGRDLVDVFDDRRPAGSV